ncbi:MAG: GDP-mannose 4,6-dehydratase [Planctomycetes bacterium]|nr:GDP-mannose 4,6-dehydratase [Planctomycetota bacterium]
MKTLVTGAAGFIGSSLVDRLLENGNEVVGLDSFDDAYDPRVKRSNLAAASRHAAFRLVEADFRHPRSLEAAFREHRPDAVVHLGARAGVRPSIEHGPLYVDVNLLGTTCVLEACRRHGVSRLLFASSSSVYGARPAEPFTEADRVDHPVSTYAATKTAGELLCYSYHHLFGLAVSALRFFTVYGPRQRPEMAIHRFTRAIDRGEPITVYGDGTQRRDFTYITDIVGGICSALERCRGYHVYNLGGGRPVELREVIRRIEEGLGKTAIVEHRDPAPGDVPHTLADISRARTDLGYEPRVGIADGIPLFIEWYVQQRQG